MADDDKDIKPGEDRPRTKTEQKLLALHDWLTKQKQDAARKEQVRLSSGKPNLGDKAGMAIRRVGAAIDDRATEALGRVTGEEDPMKSAARHAPDWLKRAFSDKSSKLASMAPERKVQQFIRTDASTGDVVHGEQETGHGREKMPLEVEMDGKKYRLNSDGDYEEVDE